MIYGINNSFQATQTKINDFLLCEEIDEDILDMGVD